MDNSRLNTSASSMQLTMFELMQAPIPQSVSGKTFPESLTRRTMLLDASSVVSWERMPHSFRQISGGG